jgi:hypothetical protein
MTIGNNLGTYWGMAEMDYLRWNEEGLNNSCYIILNSSKDYQTLTEFQKLNPQIKYIPIKTFVDYNNTKSTILRKL